HESTLPEGFNTSSIVPYFILTEMPPFIAGLLIAAIFAAAQSTISSSLNSISACISVDIKHRFFGKGEEKNEVMFARWVIVLAGIFGFGMSIYLITSDSNDLWDLFLLVTGLVGVPLAGVFAVGIFTKRQNTLGGIVGLFLLFVFVYEYYTRYSSFLLFYLVLRLFSLILLASLFQVIKNTFQV